jgi:hypothetical protein
VAYRKLFGVALVAVGVLAVGCGAGEGRSVAAAETDDGLPSVSDDQPPPSGDQPPGSDDQPPRNPDRPRFNPDQPPSGSTDDGSGPGAGGGACASTCDTIDEECEGGQGQSPLRQLCNVGCRIPDGATTVPCPNQLAALLNCAINVAGLCPTEEQAPAVQEQCLSQLQAFGACQQAAEPPDDDPDDTGNCTADGGCENCGSECNECICEADGDATEAAACLMTPACPMP